MIAETNDAYVLANSQDDASSLEDGDTVRIVRVMGAVATKYNTSILDVLKMPWCLFMALTRDLCEQLEREKKHYESEQFKSRTATAKKDQSFL